MSKCNIGVHLLTVVKTENKASGCVLFLVKVVWATLTSCWSYKTEQFPPLILH